MSSNISSLPIAARPRPSGTITFLFTSVTGGAESRTTLPVWEDILRGAVEANGGYLYKTVGDTSHAAFSNAAEAIQAVLAAWEAMRSAERPGASVKMALHTGVTEERGDDYVGPILNRAARLLAAANGGQVLLTQPTAALAQDNLPGGAGLKDLGEHRLKDLLRPERIFQLVAPELGLAADLPSLNTLEARPNNLPLQPTPFLGREHEVDQVLETLRREDVKLLTLTGPGGIGKTRLALQAAAELLDDFEDGVFFVPLAAITDPSLVAPSIGQAMGLREVSEAGPLKAIKDYLGSKHLLLVLDNLEQILEAGVDVAELVVSAPNLKVLATSRASLHLSMEHEHPVPPLSVPDPKAVAASPPEVLTQYESVELFIRRAEAVSPGFTVTNQNAPAVAEICYRLEGIPLAIELAAARIKLLSPSALLAKLGSRLKVLTGGARDLHTRQQTLRNTLEWSYDLLTDGEKQLFRRMAVFRGGQTLEALEAVCCGGPTGGSGKAVPPLEIDVLDGVSSLVSKSLLYTKEGADGEAGEARYQMLETINEYAWEKLAEAENGEAEGVREAHAAYFTVLGAQAEPHLTGAQQTRWLPRLEEEHDNIRAALTFMLSRGEAAKMIELGWSIWVFWWVHGHHREARYWMQQALEKADHGAGQPLPSLLRARALCIIGGTSYAQGDIELGISSSEEGLEIFRREGDKHGVGLCLEVLGMVAVVQGDAERGQATLEESLALLREAGDNWGSALLLGYLGVIHMSTGNLDDAGRMFQEGLTASRSIGDRFNVFLCMFHLAVIARAQGDNDRAREWFASALTQAGEISDRASSAYSMEGLASMAMANEQYERAASLFGAAHALLESIGNPSYAYTPDRGALVANIEETREHLGKEAFDLAWSRGLGMTMEQARDYALQD